MSNAMTRVGQIAFLCPLKLSFFQAVQQERLRKANTNMCHVSDGGHAEKTCETSISRRSLVVMLSLLPLALTENENGFVRGARAQQAPRTSSETNFQKLPCVGENCRSVEVRDFRVGTGREVKDGTTIVFKWTGRLADRYGWPFQREEEEDVSYVIGKDALIQGFVQGILGMKEGGKRRILIPGELGYQDERAGPLPNDFGDRRRLFGTVLNKRRFKRAGDLVIDVQLKKVRS